MPSRKQRRRRQKDRRHEYEYVYLDDEGNEVEVDPAELKSARAPATRDERRPAPARNGRSARPGRRIHPPSWRRVLRRGVMFAPVMFAAIYLLGGKKIGLAGVVYQTAVLMLFFVPFSYFMDSVLYRQYVRRTGGASGGKPSEPAKRR